MWFNFHTHSTYCDGQSSPDELKTKAENLGLVSIGFSSHAPLPFECRWCMKPDKLNEYLTEIKALRDSERDGEIYSGLEVDYIPNAIGPADFDNQLDFTIGSIHFVDQFESGTRWEIDGAHPEFLVGLDEIFNGDMKAVVSRYFELTREMVSRSVPHVVGHLDKVKMQNIENKFFNEDDGWYHREIIKTLDVIQSAGCIVEVNTRGLYKKKTTSTYPSPWILALMHRKKIPITISSDAHQKDELIKCFPETLASLKAIGFKEVHALSKGKWKAFAFDERGVKI